MYSEDCEYVNIASGAGVKRPSPYSNSSRSMALDNLLLPKRYSLYSKKRKNKKKNTALMSKKHDRTFCIDTEKKGKLRSNVLNPHNTNLTMDEALKKTKKYDCHVDLLLYTRIIL